MKKKLRLLVGGLTLSLFLIGILVYSYSRETSTLENQRKKHSEFLQKSPFKKTLTWDKKTRKLNGLPPNKYYEQMWELTINPSTGKLDDGNITLLREKLQKNRRLQKNPGDTGNSWEERGPNNVGGRTRVLCMTQMMPVTIPFTPEV